MKGSLGLTMVLGLWGHEVHPVIYTHTHIYMYMLMHSGHIHKHANAVSAIFIT